MLLGMHANRRSFLLSILILFAPIGTAVHAMSTPPDLNGEWSGFWERDGDRLDVTVHFISEVTGWKGTFDSDRLRAIGIPFRDITVDGSSVQWKLVGDATSTTFSGVLTEDTLAGEFEEQGATGTVLLTRIDVPAPKLAEHVFTFRNGEVLLAGTLLMPPDSGRKPAAVVFFHGSGPEGRWASLYLATRFARAGVAALIFDKRGVGESKGNWRDATYDELAGDVAAAVEALRRSALVDSVRIGIHGHSQGGTLAPLAAGK